MVMTRDVRFVTPGTTIEAALSLMHVTASPSARHRRPQGVCLVSIGESVRQLIERGEGDSKRQFAERAPRIDSERLAGENDMDASFHPAAAAVCSASALALAGCSRRRPR